MPATVHVVLAARIDRLTSEEKHLLQTAAVIGTDVPLSLLRGMAEVPEDAFHTTLSRLQAAEGAAAGAARAHCRRARGG